MPRGVRLPKTSANELKLNLFEFLQRVQQRFNKVKGNKRLVNGSGPAGQTKNNQQLTTASTLFRVEAVVSYSHPPDLSGGYFNIIANKCNLTPLFDTSKKYSIPRLGKQQT